jgi:hypothetical protein
LVCSSVLLNEIFCSNLAAMLLTMSFFGGWVFDTSFKRPYVQRSSPDRQKGERLVAEGKNQRIYKDEVFRVDGWMGGFAKVDNVFHRLGGFAKVDNGFGLI